MWKLCGLGAVIVGGVLLFYGVNERNSVTSQVKEAFTGSPTDHSVVLMGGGGALAAIGLALLVLGKKA